MSRRSASPLDVRDAKRPRLDGEVRGLTPEDYKHGIMLAPMVRSGALPTRLFALKHGAKLVWGPEIVDKAILHAKRVVDPTTGVISYEGKSKAMFTCHPLEKPFLIYQIGSSTPSLAVQAARVVMQDVSGIDLNCGCPKPFSTHSGMGAALLSTPDLLCDILTALRRELPERISVSCKIRLLGTKEETLELVRRIVGTGVNCLTIHCRTRSMRNKERALQERLREVVEFVRNELKSDVAIVENGDCVGYEDARRILALTGADSTMIATAAESNPTVFSKEPLFDLEHTLVPDYLRMCKYLGNHWSSTKWCLAQFKSPRSPNSSYTKSQALSIRNALSKAKSYDDPNAIEIVEGKWNGKEVWDELEGVVRSRTRNVDEGDRSRVDVWPAEEMASTEEESGDGGAKGKVDGVAAHDLEKAEEMQVEDKKETYPSIDAERSQQHSDPIATPQDPATHLPSTPTPMPNSTTNSPDANAMYTTPQDYRGNPNPENIYDAPGVPGSMDISKMLRIVPALVEGRDVDLDTPTPSQKG